MLDKTLHLSLPPLSVCPSPEYLTPAIGQKELSIWRPSNISVGVRRENKPGEVNMAKAEELCNSTRIHAEVFSAYLPTISQAGLGCDGLRENGVRVGEGRRRRRGKCGIF